MPRVRGPLLFALQGIESVLHCRPQSDIDNLASCADNEHIVYPEDVMSEDVGLRIRVDDRLRHDFIETCKALDTTAAQVLRAFMRSYVEQHGEKVRQGQLFDARSPSAASESLIR